jgi:hypothetical protein
VSHDQVSWLKGERRAGCPTSHNWGPSEPSRWFMQAAQMHLNLNIPVISPMLAVEYFFVCSLPGSVAERRHR